MLARQRHFTGWCNSEKFKVQNSKFKIYCGELPSGESVNWLIGESNNNLFSPNPHSPFTLILIFAFCIFIIGCKGNEPAREAAPSPSQEVQTPAAETPDIQKKTVPSPETARPNRPPRVESVDVTPLFPKIGDTLKITAKATDPDGGEVKLIYQWFKNDEPLLETSETLSLTKDFNRGDRITLNVIPDDGKERGSPGLMKVTIGNSPPEIVSSSSESRFENQRFTYQVKAVDPENDSITYSLKTSPSGMNIDPSTGMITWDVPSDFRGKAQVVVIASDNHSGEAMQSFVFEIRTE